MNRNNYLFSAIMMVIITLVIIYICFAFLPPEKNSLLVVCSVSVAGFALAYMFYETYRQTKK